MTASTAVEPMAEPEAQQGQIQSGPRQPGTIASASATAMTCTIDGVAWEFGQKVIVPGLEESDAPVIGYITAWDVEQGALEVTSAEVRPSEKDGEPTTVEHSDWYDADDIRPYVENTAAVEHEFDPKAEWERDWIEKVREKSAECQSLEYAYELRKSATKEAKEELDRALKELRQLTSQFYQEMPLFEQGRSSSDAPAGEATTEAEDTSWRETPISDLIDCGLPSNIRDLLFAAEFQTIGQLADHTAADKQLTDIAKIGPTKAMQIEAALEEFWRRRQASGGDCGTESPGDEVTETDSEEQVEESVAADPHDEDGDDTDASDQEGSGGSDDVF